MYQRFEEEKIYHIRYFNLLSNNQRYSLTVQPYIININEKTIITQIEENIPPIPSYIFRPQRYPQLISLASAFNFLPGKLSLTTTPGSRFYFDTDIDIIQRFQKKNKLLY
ncbi:hypothetical protein Bca52824_056490 [Brassica carinata]|uniref:Uncharacterized protein n=1 Tax=Brassica carinata TaxID=52824 RepID=A0A8X7QNY0_BRACI|nr:hypothetical protein Bca52824_056490 [Brassica carinata]